MAIHEQNSQAQEEIVHSLEEKIAAMEGELKETKNKSAKEFHLPHN